jgi:hypothetical protein
MNFKKLACTLLITFQLIGCSTSGGIYKKDDAKDGEFSVGRTALTILGVAAAVAAAKGGGGGGYQAQGYAWDYQPGNRQWVCRDKSNGQYARKENCAGIAVVDHWPNN